jgi:hypothetical protein
MKTKLILLFLFTIQINSSLIGKNTPNSTDSLKKQVEYLNKTVEKLKNQQENQKEQITYQKELITSQTGMIDTAFDGVSAELGSSSNTIGIFGIIVTIIAIALSIYLTRLERNVTRMLAESTTLLGENIKIRQELESLNEKITKDGKALYEIVRNEESNHLLDRLISVPEDIANLFRNLASRDLEPIHFLKLKEAYLQFIGQENEFLYIRLFFQHFSGLSLLDSEIKPLFMKELDQGFYAAFKNDAVKSASDFFNAIMKIGVSKSRKDINDYVTQLCKSKFSTSEEIYFAINNEMKNKELKFELYDNINKIPETFLFRKMLGQLILDHKFENLNEQEEAIIQDIKTILK